MKMPTKLTIDDLIHVLEVCKRNEGKIADAIEHVKNLRPALEAGMRPRMRFKVIRIADNLIQAFLIGVDGTLITDTIWNFQEVGLLKAQLGNLAKAIGLTAEFVEE